ncbi:hypothetical protein [Novosphingobium panipatense]|uniref:hypothetical protein n=1 Tax=Novosphingobium panipatense TaxID=428991 RepID=UPI0036195529
MIDPAARPGSFDAVRAQWTGLDDAAWRTAVASGVVPDSAAPLERVGTAGLVLPPIPPQTLTIDLRPSSQLYDGRFSTNAWAQECPDPITKEAWGSSARMHAGDMSRLGLKEGSLIRIDRGGSAILPVRAVSGQALGTVTLVTGYGREGTGQIADGLGASAWALGGNGTPALRLRRAGARSRRHSRCSHSKASWRSFFRFLLRRRRCLPSRRSPRCCPTRRPAAMRRRNTPWLSTPTCALDATPA